MANDPVYWTMRDGKRINVDDMDINHLRNTLKMLIREKERQEVYDDIIFDPYWDLGSV